MSEQADEARHRKLAPYGGALLILFSLGALVVFARTNLAVKIACLIGMILAMPAIGFVCYRSRLSRQCALFADVNGGGEPFDSRSHHYSRAKDLLNLRPCP